MEASSLRFAAAARTIGDVARAGGLMVPGFRSPPRLAGVDRTLRWHVDATGEVSATVSIRIKGRPWVSVLADMIDGVIVANKIDGLTAGAARTALWAAVEPDLLGGAHPGPTGNTTSAARGRAVRSGRHRAPQPAPALQSKVA